MTITHPTFGYPPIRIWDFKDTLSANLTLNWEPTKPMTGEGVEPHDDYQPTHWMPMPKLPEVKP